MSLHYFPNQRDSLMEAVHILDRLPNNVQWSFMATEADTWTDPSVLNIYIEPGGVGPRGYGAALNLGEVVDEGERFTSYRVGPLLVSIEEYEHARE